LSFLSVLAACGDAEVVDGAEALSPDVGVEGVELQAASIATVAATREILRICFRKV
jgi:hypothetical protein